METIEALIHRRSCRKYSDRPVEAEKLARILSRINPQFVPPYSNSHPRVTISFPKSAAALKYTLSTLSDDAENTQIFID